MGSPIRLQNISPKECLDLFFKIPGRIWIHFFKFWRVGSESDSFIRIGSGYSSKSRNRIRFFLGVGSGSFLAIGPWFFFCSQGSEPDLDFSYMKFRIQNRFYFQIRFFYPRVESESVFFVEGRTRSILGDMVGWRIAPVDYILSDWVGSTLFIKARCHRPELYA